MVVIELKRRSWTPCANLLLDSGKTTGVPRPSCLLLSALSPILIASNASHGDTKPVGMSPVSLLNLFVSAANFCTLQLEHHTTIIWALFIDSFGTPGDCSRSSFVESLTGSTGSCGRLLGFFRVGSPVVIRGTAALADGCAEIVGPRTLQEDQENGSQSWNAGCYDDDVHFDSGNEAVSLHIYKNTRTCWCSARYLLTRST